MNPNDKLNEIAAEAANKIAIELPPSFIEGERGDWSTELPSESVIKPIVHAAILEATEELRKEHESERLRFIAEIERRVKELVEVKGQLTEALKDKERVDQLETMVFINREREKQLNVDFFGLSLREAIAAAMTNETKEREGK